MSYCKALCDHINYHSRGNPFINEALMKEVSCISHGHMVCVPSSPSIRTCWRPVGPCRTDGWRAEQKKWGQRIAKYSKSTGSGIYMTCVGALSSSFCTIWIDMYLHNCGMITFPNWNRHTRQHMHNLTYVFSYRTIECTVYILRLWRTSPASLPSRRDEWFTLS